MVGIGRGVLTGIAGVAAMYYLDPLSGRRRRHELQNAFDHWSRTLSRSANVAARDFIQRSRGKVTEIKHRRAEETVSDDVLAERVRSKIGRACSHPGAVEVLCEGGRVTLRGPVLSIEAASVLRAAEHVHGVLEVIDALERHEEAGAVSDLQGGRVKSGERSELMQQRWAPSVRFTAGLGGLGLVAYAVGRRSLASSLAGLLGAGLFARSFSNLDLRHLLGITRGPAGIDVMKTIHVKAPIEDVWALLMRSDAFPRYMPHVLEVKRVGDLWHWKVAGPANLPIEFEARVTQYVEGELLAWRSTERSPLPNEGVVRVDRDDTDRTRVQFRISYNPPVGAIGHAIARLVHGDPKHRLDEDLIRFKSLLENGRATGRVETVTREQILQNIPTVPGSTMPS